MSSSNVSPLTLTEPDASKAPGQLRPLLFSSAQLERFGTNYQTALQHSDLWQPSALGAVAVTFRSISAIYLWTLAYQGQRYGIYAGKSKSLGNRIKNYAGVFQPHSPNDFKLQVFHAFAQKHFMGAELSMHFMLCDIAQLAEQETREIRFFLPLLNLKMHPGDQARQDLQRAFASFYEAGFTKALLGG